MAEEVIRILITQATSILVQHVRDQLNQLVNVEDDINKLVTILDSIKAKVNDAEKREIEDETIKQWVKNLKSTSYDIDDALTDWNIAIREVNGNTSRSNLRKKVCLAIVFPCVFSNQIAPLREVAKIFKRINRNLVSIDTAKNAFKFDSNLSNPNDEQTVFPEPQSENETNSFVDQSTIFGREIEKSIVLSKLTNEGNPRIVFIWGMGGIGKSTIAQLIFDCLEIQQNFEIKMWVSVGRTFDGKRVAKAIAKQVDKDCSLDFNESQTALGHIRDSVNKKKFLLVLDNLWLEDHNGLEPIFAAVKVGAPGSKILITSQNEGVGRKIEAILTNTELFSIPSCQNQIGSPTFFHNLKGLSNEHTWTVFKRFAFSGRNREFYEDLKVIGKTISDECKGLPLAAKAVGSLMMLKDTKHEWEHVLNDEIWRLNLHKDLSRPLLLSYYDLPPVIKRCFCYCANFAKDSKIDAVNLIQMWMSQGYLGSNESIEMEITGRGYLNNLVRRSLFQDPEKDKDNGTVLRFKMHEMVHDVANYLMENECLMVTGTYSEEGRFRHLTITHEENPTFPVPHKSLNKLYTYSVQSFHDCPSMVTQDCIRLPSMFFGHFKYLKTLDMSRNMLSTIPNDLKNLKNLRYLNLSHNPFYNLPETLCTLANLQTLKLVSCIHLTELPQNIGNLENLRHLEIDDTKSLVTMPKGIGKLTSLRTLSQFFIGTEDESCSLVDLKHLNHITGSLKIEGLNQSDVNEAREAELEKKEHLVDLHINCSLRSLESGSLESGGVDALKLNLNLRALQIDCYVGQRFPNWMVSLTNLKKIRLQKWDRCHCLPPLGKLPMLKILHIEGFKALIRVDSEFLGVESDVQTSSIIVFPKLEKLKFSKMENWKEWNVVKNIKIMPSLRYLKLSECKTLQSVPREVLGLPIKKLRIRSCVILKERYQKETGKDWEMASHISSVRIRNG